MKIKNTLILFLIIFCILQVFGIPESDVINSYKAVQQHDSAYRLSNYLFFQPDGEYYFSVKHEYEEIDDNFFTEILSGNIFVLFNWTESLMLEKSNELIRIRFNGELLRNSKISEKLLKIFDSCLGAFAAFIDKTVEIVYDEFITIKYEVTGDKALFIHKVAGIKINNISFGEKIQKILDISRYRILYKDNYVFFGIIDPENDYTFDYYIYTSVEDITDRGLNNVIRYSNQQIRNNLRPLIINFFK